jgi:sorting nexin-1/2
VFLNVYQRINVSSRQYFDIRRASIDALEQQLKSLHNSLATVTKARLSLASSVQELSVAVSMLSQCELAAPTRHVLEALANLEERVRGLIETEARVEEAGIVAKVDSYVRLISSVRVRTSSPV